MDKLIGRERELEELQWAMNAYRSELVTLYGRWRVGKTMIRKALLLMLMLSVAANINAEIVEIDGVSYSYDTEYGSATVTSGDNKYSGSVSIPETITFNERTYTVTCIGDWAFSSCSGLFRVIIPNTVTSIGSGAFQNCSKLYSINIPSSVTTIADNAFYGCAALPIVNSCRYAGNFLVEFVDKTSTKCSVKEGTLYIGYYAFNGCTNLTEVNLPEGLRRIGASAFQGCSSLSSITIPMSVDCIGISAFYNCSSLVSISIPKGIGVSPVYSTATLTVPIGTKGCFSLFINSIRRFYKLD